MSDDCISRRAAIDAVLRAEALVMAYGYRYAADALRELPAAQPERKKGKWIERDDGWDGVYYECSVCKEPFTLIDGTPSENLYNYCPNCGADMRGENDDIPIEYFESGGK